MSSNWSLFYFNWNQSVRNTTSGLLSPGMNLNPPCYDDVLDVLPDDPFEIERWIARSYSSVKSEYDLEIERWIARSYSSVKSEYDLEIEQWIARSYSSVKSEYDREDSSVGFELDFDFAAGSLRLDKWHGKRACDNFQGERCLGHSLTGGPLRDLDGLVYYPYERAPILQVLPNDLYVNWENLWSGNHRGWANAKSPLDTKQQTKWCMAETPNNLGCLDGDFCTLNGSQLDESDAFLGMGVVETSVREPLDCSVLPDSLVFSVENAESKEGRSCSLSSEDQGEIPHDGFCFALRYLTDARDLLSVGQVCKYLQSYVSNDSLLWQRIEVYAPLIRGLNDERLLMLTDRAQGQLKSLTLMNFKKISGSGISCNGSGISFGGSAVSFYGSGINLSVSGINFSGSGIRKVIERNPKLRKLIVPTRSQEVVQGIIQGLKSLQSRGHGHALELLRIGYPDCMRLEEYEELKSLMSPVRHESPKPRFYHIDNAVPFCHGCSIGADDGLSVHVGAHHIPKDSIPVDVDDGRPIDVDVCPRCHNLSILYDCPAEGCKLKQSYEEQCHACTLCIPRCGTCGECLNDNKYTEGFHLQNICANCEPSSFPVAMLVGRLH